jgi:hypothetical protein
VVDEEGREREEAVVETMTDASRLVRSTDLRMWAWKPETPYWRRTNQSLRDLKEEEGRMSQKGSKGRGNRALSEDVEPELSTQGLRANGQNDQDGR